MVTVLREIPNILESNLHPFYSWAKKTDVDYSCVRSRAGFWKNDRAAVHAERTMQYNNLLFCLLLIII